MVTVWNPRVQRFVNRALKLNDQATSHNGIRLIAIRADGSAAINAKGSIRLVEVSDYSIRLRDRGGAEVSRPWSMIGTAGITGFAKLLHAQFCAAA
jgi:hypothetical protein